MRTTQFMITAAIVITGFTACDNSAKDAAKQDAAILTQYVDSVESLKPVYTLESWTAIDNVETHALVAVKHACHPVEISDLRDFPVLA